MLTNSVNAFSPSIRDKWLELYIDLIQNMKNNNLSEQEIAKLTNRDIEIVRKVLNNEKFEITLHLLEH